MNELEGLKGSVVTIESGCSAVESGGEGGFCRAHWIYHTRRTTGEDALISRAFKQNAVVIALFEDGRYKGMVIEPNWRAWVDAQAAEARP